MSTGLINIIKQASLDAMDNAQMSDLRYGKVVSVSPLKVQITAQFIIPESLLVVPQHLTTYKLECTISEKSKSISGKTEKSEELNSEEDPLKKHTHNFNVTLPASEEKQVITVHNGLKIGDKGALLRQQGGQSYFILDRI